MLDLCAFILPSFCIYFEVLWADIAFCGCDPRDSEWIIWNQDSRGTFIHSSVCTVCHATSLIKQYLTVFPTRYDS